MFLMKLSVKSNVFHIVAISSLVLLSTAMAVPYDFKGLVTGVSDGDTFHVSIQSVNQSLIDSKTEFVSGIGPGDNVVVRLADINCPEIDEPGGKEAKAFVWKMLYNRTVVLDASNAKLHNSLRTDRYERLVCVAYIPDSNGFIDVSSNLNKVLLDLGLAELDDLDNEFNPSDWPSTSLTEASLSTFNLTEIPVVGSKAFREGVYHYPDCRFAKKTKKENSVQFESCEDAQLQGYRACMVCHPL